MPELPEVETIVNGVKPYLINKKIIKCNVFTKKLRWNLQNDLAKKLINKKINKIERRAKYIIISGENFFLTIHLGMTGTLRVSNKKEKKEKHDHFILQLSSKYILKYNDPRKFGMIFFSEESPIAPKEARLVAVSVSAAIRCEYCVSAQEHLAKKAGATDDEIKAAIQIAAEIQRFSVLLYGNDFGMEKLNKIIGKE